jgi:phospholipid/cholesterol/gamma-HCH transport system substrate-binding protein
MRPGHHKRLPNHVIGLILVALIAVGSYLAYTKKLPWSHGYEVKAVFTTAENIRPKSPVRIAGVNVGEVTSVEPCTNDNPACGGVDGGDVTASTAGVSGGQGGASGLQAAIVTMEISDEGRPIKDDATFKLRPRLFLEGNLFVDVNPGSPQAPEVSSDHTFSVTQTSASVQLDQVLTTLQSGVRNNLQIFLKEFGDALIKHGGATGFRELFRTSPGAYRYTSLVNQAFLGTEPHDLSNLVRDLDSTVQALDADERGLQDLVTNLRVVTGSFAAQNQALSAAIADLPRFLEVGQPALAALDRSFPPLRAFAREALPGTRSTPETLDAATPLLNQIRHLVSQSELRGLSQDLRQTIPSLTKLSHRTIPFLDSSRALSSCFNQVIIPWSNSSVPDSNFPPATVTDGAGTHPATVSQETGYGLVGIGGESRSGDANGEYIRVEFGGGTNTPILPGPIQGTVGKVIENSNPSSSTVPFVGFAESQILGSQPNLAFGHEDSAKPPFRPDAPCERQEPPNLQTSNGPAPEQVTPSGLPLPTGAKKSSPLASLTEASSDFAKQYAEAQRLRADGKQARADALIARATEDWLHAKAKSEPQLRAQLRAGQKREAQLRAGQKRQAQLRAGQKQEASK